jgi:hypothetical protein
MENGINKPSPRDVAACRLRGFETCLCLARLKVLERLIFQQIISFLEDHKILFSVKIWSIRFLVFPSGEIHVYL